jgi:hypothetical protein
MSSRTKSQIKIWGVSGLLSISSLLIGYHYGKASDCRPDQIDGQCGLSTAVETIFGVIGVILVLICATFCSIYLSKRNTNHDA